MGGADVTIRQGNATDHPHVQRRIIDGGSGYGCQQEPVAHFGLGNDFRSPVEVAVRWPDGAVNTQEIGIDNFIMMEYPSDQYSKSTPVTPGGSQFRHTSHIEVNKQTHERPSDKPPRGREEVASSQGQQRESRGQGQQG